MNRLRSYDDRRRRFKVIALAWMLGCLVVAVSIASEFGTSAIDIGRQFLIERDTQQAESIFLQVWQSKTAPAAERERAAFYLGLLANGRADGAAARKWFSQAAELAPNAERRDVAALHACLTERANDAEDADRLYDDVPRPSDSPDFVQRRPWKAIVQEPSASIQFVSFTRSAAQDAPDHTRSQAAFKLVQEARSLPQTSLENRIKLMSSLLMHAEFAARDQEDLYTLANDHFEEGMKLYADIEKAIKDDAKAAEAEAKASGKEKRKTDLENLLLNPNTAAVVMRWDAVMVRWNVIKDKRAPASRAEERKRIEHLRQLVTTYRDCTGKTAAAMTLAMLGDSAAAELALQEATAKFDCIKEIATAEPRDFYLLHPESDAQIDYVPVQPFGPDFTAQLTAVQALVKLQAAERGGVDAEAELAAAVTLAQQALDQQQGKSENAVAHFVLGRAGEIGGKTKLAGALAQAAARPAAKADFDSAIAHFEKCRELLGGQAGVVHGGEPAPEIRRRPAEEDRFVSRPAAKARWRESSPEFQFASLRFDPAFQFAGLARAADPAPPRVLADVTKRLSELTADEPFLTEAKRLTGEDQVVGAFAELERGLTSRPQAGEALWHEWAHAGLRAGADPDRILTIFEDAGKASLIPNSVLGRQIRAKVILARAMKQMAEIPLEKMDADTRAALAAEMRAVVELLDADARISSGVEQAGVRAYWTLAVALASMANPADASLVDRRMEAYEWAKDAHLHLVREARAHPDRLDLREAVVAARMSIGQLSLQLTGDRGDAVKAFSAAINELASLPSQPAAAKMLGMPLLETLRASVPADELRRQETERQVRQAQQHVLDGAISFIVGDTKAATLHMDRGLVRLQTAAGLTPLNDADQLVSDLDGVEVQLVVPDLLRAVKVLALVQQCDSEAEADERQRLAESAVREAEQLATAAPGGPHQALSGIALALALEQRAVASGLLPNPARTQDLARSRSELARSLGQLTDDLRRRYPTMAKMADDANQRLSNASFYATRILAARQEYRLGDAERLLNQALARYENSPALWNQLLEVTVEQADLEETPVVAGGPAPDSKIRQVLRDMARHGMGTAYQRAYWEGYVRERAKQWPDAEQSYRQAAQLAQSDGERVQATSKAAFAVTQRLTANN